MTNLQQYFFGLNRFDVEAEVYYRTLMKPQRVFVTFSAQTAELARELANETLRGWKNVQHVEIIGVVLKPSYII